MSHDEGHYNKQENGGNYGRSSMLDPLRKLFHSGCTSEGHTDTYADVQSQQSKDKGNPLPVSPIQAVKEQPADKTRQLSLGGMIMGLMTIIVGMYMLVFLWGITWCRYDSQRREEEKLRMEQERVRKERLAAERERIAKLRVNVARKAARNNGATTAGKTADSSTSAAKATASAPKPRKESSNRATSYVCYYNVGDIAAGAFAYCRYLRYVDVECRSIGSKAFLSCTALEELTVRAGLTQIGSKAFADCPRLTIALFPKTVHSMGKDAFDGTTSIREVSIPYKVREQMCRQISQCNKINTIYILSDTFFKMPRAMREGGLERSMVRLYVPDALLADFCKDHEWILFNEILPLSKSKWYDAHGIYKND